MRSRPAAFVVGPILPLRSPRGRQRDGLCQLTRVAAGVCALMAPLVSGACGAANAPSSPSPVPSGPRPVNLTGNTIDGMTEAPLAGVTVRIEGVGEAVSDSAGRFELTAPNPQQARSVVVSSRAVITRETRLLAPGPPASLALMPASLDLAAFDQLFRSSGGTLRRWTTAPSVIICDRVLRFTNVSDVEYAATGGALSGEEIESILRDLAWGLDEATGNTYAAFGSTSRQSASAGDRVAVRHTGAVVVARYEGLQEATGYWGYGRWASDSTGAVVSGIVMLDARFDRSSSPYTRSLRVHELGHALGYGHVTARTSFMNTSGCILPTTFDTAAARLAFRRPPLNRSPDIDPVPMTANLRTGEVTWSGLP